MMVACHVSTSRPLSLLFFSHLCLLRCLSVSRLGRVLFRERDTRTLYRLVRSKIHHIIMLLIRLEQIEIRDTNNVISSPISSGSTRRQSKRISPARDLLVSLTPALTATSNTSSMDGVDDLLIHADIHLHLYHLYRLIWQLYHETRSKWTHHGDITLLKVMRQIVWMMNEEMTCEQQRCSMEQIYRIHPQLAQSR